jgi:hypothetical protein
MSQPDRWNSPTCRDMLNRRDGSKVLLETGAAK